MSFVVDASVFLPLVVMYGRRLKNVLEKYEFHVLDLTCYEVCNGLWKESVKLHRIDGAIASKLCSYFREVVKRYARVHSILELDVEKVMRIALEYNMTVYDASYIELAREYSMPIASNDRDILDNAPKLGVKVYDLENFTKTL